MTALYAHLYAKGIQRTLAVGEHVEARVDEIFPSRRKQGGSNHVAMFVWPSTTVCRPLAVTAIFIQQQYPGT